MSDDLGHSLSKVDEAYFRNLFLQKSVAAAQWSITCRSEEEWIEKSRKLDLMSDRSLSGKSFEIRCRPALLAPAPGHSTIVNWLPITGGGIMFYRAFERSGFNPGSMPFNPLYYTLQKRQDQFCYKELYHQQRVVTDKPYTGEQP